MKKKLIDGEGFGNEGNDINYVIILEIIKNININSQYIAT